MSNSSDPSTSDETIVGNTFGEFLQKQYLLRKEKNSKYSMRSFALKIGIDQSLISKVISGKRELSFLSMKNCLEKLEIPQSLTDELLTRFSKKIIYHRTLDEDVFMTVSHWCHFAILELFKLKDFVADTHIIAERLNLDSDLVEDCLGRLERFGFLSSDNGQYALSRPNNTWASHTATSEARRLLQKTFLEKSIDALENVPLEQRHHSSYTFAVSTQHLNELKEKILEMTIQLGNMASAHQTLNEVYQFTVSLYPLTKPKDQT